MGRAAPDTSKDDAVTAWFRRKPNPFKGVDFLDLVPRARVDVTEDPETGQVVALVPRFRDPVWGRFLQPRLPAGRRWVKVRLDERGAVLWRAMDGRTPIRDLVGVYQAAFPDDVQEAAERVSQWFYAGYESGLIAFAGLGS